MNESDRNQKVELDDVMLAMDVVDTLRHQESLVDRELKAEDRDRALVEKVRDIYAGQGIAVSDAVIEEGVKALREERFAYRPPEKSFQLSLARLYVNRGRWAKRGAFAALALLLLFLAYRFAVVAPRQRENLRQQKTLLQLKEMPEKLAAQRDLVVAEAMEGKARERATALYNDAMAAVSRQDAEAANKAYLGLTQLYDELARQYRLRVVSRREMPSGVWRIPDNNPGARNHYIIVEAVTPDGRTLKLPVTSEEDGMTRVVENWGLRVSPEVFEQVRRDKMDDGIIQKNLVGEKKRGYLTPVYTIPTSGGAITEW